MTRIVIGADPGVSGALALVTRNRVLTIADMPTEAGAAGRKRVSAPLLVHLLRTWIDGHDPPPVAAIEQVSAMPRQGVSSMFSLGRSAGVVEGVLAALGLEVTSYSAAAWKRHMKLTGKAKDASRARALQLYPDAAPWLMRVKDHGRAEATLIARMRIES